MIAYTNRLNVRHKNKTQYWQNPVFSWLILKILFGRSELAPSQDPNPELLFIKAKDLSVTAVSGSPFLLQQKPVLESDSMSWNLFAN